jgi:hypothetical protein
MFNRLYGHTEAPMKVLLLLLLVLQVPNESAEGKVRQLMKIADLRKLEPFRHSFLLFEQCGEYFVRDTYAPGKRGPFSEMIGFGYRDGDTVGTVIVQRDDVIVLIEKERTVPSLEFRKIKGRERVIFRMSWEEYQKARCLPNHSNRLPE